MDRKLNGMNPLSYRGVNAYSPPEMLTYKRPPTTKDWRNMMIGTIWLDTTNNPPDSADIYMLVDVANQVVPAQPIATWVSFAGGGLGPQTLTGDMGGAVSPDGADNINLFSGITGLTFDGNPGAHKITANNSGGGPLFQTLSDDIGTLVVPDNTGDIGILGTAGRITSTANPAAHSITFDIDGDFGDKFTANDTNHAVPAAGNLNILGAGNIYTSVPAGDTIQIDLIGTTNHALQLGNASGSLTSLGVATNGQLPIGSVGANPVLNTLTAGTGISVTNAPGSITVAVSANNRPAFQAYLTGNEILGQTGDGTVWQIPFDAFTLDNTSGLVLPAGYFDVTIAGIYYFSFDCGYHVVAGGGQTWNIQITKAVGPGFVPAPVYSQGGGMPTALKVANFQGPNNAVDMFIAGIVQCAAGDRIACTVTGFGGAKNDGVQGGNGNPGFGTAFSGFLIGIL